MLALKSAAFCLLITLLSLSSQAANFTVTNVSDSGAGSLRAALSSANNNNQADSITFANSLQNQTLVLTSDELRITSEVTLIGFTNASFTISGDLTHRLFALPGDAAIVTMNNLTLIDGIGSGIASSGTLTLNNCTLRNHQGGRGAALLNEGGSITLNDCLIEGNISDDDAAVNSFGSGPNLINRCRFVGNRSDRNGGAFASFGPFTVTDSTFEDNWAGLNGAGLFNGNNLDLINCTFLNNQAIISGGAIDNRGGSLNAINCTFDNNSAASGGAIVARFGINLINCTIANNSASGISNISSLTQSEIINGFNGAENFVDAGNINAIGTAGGLLTLASGNFNLANTILANNSPQQISTQPSTTIFLNGNNLASDDSFAAVSNLVNANNLIANTNPLLAPLSNNGGQVFTFALLPNSPAIDAGENSIINNAPISFNSDARGSDRILAGLPSSNNPTVDLGAFELNAQDTSPFSVCLSIEMNSANQPVLTVDGSPGTTYLLLESENFNFDSNSPLQTFTLDDTGQYTFTDTSSLPIQNFYSLQLVSSGS